MRRFVLLMFTAFSIITPANAFATATDDTTGTGDGSVPATTIDNSFLDTERDLTECLNNSVELPGCGRAPTQEGDRGGALQLATFGILTLAIAFICWRVAKGIRARDAAIAARIR